MTADIFTIVRKELKEFLVQRGSGKMAVVGFALPVLMLGVWVPFKTGARWAEAGGPLLMLAWMPMFLVMNVMADSFAGERERHTLETLLATRLSDQAILLGKIVAGVTYAWGMVLVSMALGLITVNVAHGHGKLLMFPAARGIAVVVFSLLLSAVTSCVAVLVSLRAATVRQAAQMLSLGFMVIIFLIIFGWRALPAEWQARALGALSEENLYRSGVLAATGLTLLNVVLYEVARLRFQRARLILD